MRGIAALMVVLFHVRGMANEIYHIEKIGDLLFGPGAFGVDLFFIISGFIIVISTNKLESNQVVKYSIRRFFRVYPLLFASVIVFYILFFNDSDFKYLSKSLIPLHANYSDPAPFFGYNILAPAWTLSYEILFYLIFGVSMAISHKYRAIISSIIIFLLVFGIRYFLSDEISLAIDINVSSKLGFLDFISSPLLIEFFYGMLLAYAYLSINLSKFNNISSSFLLVLFPLFLSFYLSWYRFGHGPINFGLWAIAFMLPFLIREKEGIIKGKNVVLLKLGDLSYSLYMTHIITIFALNKYDLPFNMYNSITGYSKISFAIFASIMVAILFNIIIEKPFINLSRKIIGRL